MLFATPIGGRLHNKISARLPYMYGLALNAEIVQPAEHVGSNAGDIALIIEDAVPFVDAEEVGHGIVADDDVGFAVVVHVDEDGGESVVIVLVFNAGICSPGASRRGPAGRAADQDSRDRTTRGSSAETARAGRKLPKGDGSDTFSDTFSLKEGSADLLPRGSL